MFTLRRWWNRYWIQVGLIGMAIASALLLRQTNGAVLFESYHLLTGLFRPNPAQENLLANAQNQELQQRLTEMETQNQQLRSLLGYLKTQPKTGIPSAIVGRSADHWWQQFLLGRGALDGVQVGSVVMAPGGLVGRVVSVTPTTSRVLLLSDPSSRVGVTVSRSRNMGYLRGQTSRRAVMEFFDKVPDVKPGDPIVTSSLSQLYPPGLPVGRVESIDLNKSPAPEAVVELSAPISFLEWVIVYPYTPTDQPAVNSPDRLEPPP